MGKKYAAWRVADNAFDAGKVVASDVLKLIPTANGGPVIEAPENFPDGAVESDVDIPQRVLQQPGSLRGVGDIGWVMKMPEVVSRRM